MSGQFSFGQNRLQSTDFAPWTVFSTGDPQSIGINNPAHFSALGLDGNDFGNFSNISPLNDRDIVAIALHAGQTVTFDIDFGVNQLIDDSRNVDLEVWLVDSNGRIVGNNDDPAGPDFRSVPDNGGTHRDPLLTLTAQTTGLYFLVVAHFSDNYLNGSFTFAGGTDTGDYVLNISTPTLPTLTPGTDGIDQIVRLDLPDRVDLLGGDDSAVLAGGNDIADGGGGADTINGGNGDDLLSGGLGNDTLLGGANRDVLVGGSNVDNLSGGTENDELFGGFAPDTVNGDAGNDLVAGESGGDNLNGGAGIDTLSYGGSSVAVNVNLLTNVASGGDAAGDTIQQFENVIGSIANDTLVGNNGANTIDGTAGGDTLAGAGGNDLLIGGRGADAMDGGTGIDTVSYTTSPLGVFVNLATNAGGGDAGGDFIQNVENVIGSQFGDTLIGTAFVNVLQGGGGHNSLDGAGGADTMIGGTGDDAYIVTTVGTTVVEGAGEGDMDQVASNISIALAANVERLLLFGSANISGIGNSLANVIFGNTGHNILNGLVGADLMTGDIGNDTYFVDNAGDVVTENGGEGTDTVQQSISTNAELAANVENVVLTGTGNISVRGNALANGITGNSGNNTLFFSAGLDVMRGGLGNDIMQVDDTGDVVVEFAGQGHDTIESFVDYTLPNNVEDLNLLFPAAHLGMGNALANDISGNSSENYLDGQAGADTMQGFDGNDTYIVDNPADVVIEESGNHGGDRIDSFVTRTLDAHVEDLFLVGAGNINGTGNGLSNFLTGNNAGNTLSGEGETDVIDGLGGNDTIRGGAGFDILFGGAGSDTVDYRDQIARVVLSLAFAESIVSVGGVEEDEITDFENAFGGSGSDEFIGNDAANVLLGGAGGDSLSGAGGGDVLNGEAGNDILNGDAGADVMNGGLGNDTMSVDSAADRVVEAAGGGTDIVRAFASYGLAAGASVETLAASPDVGAINLTGNEIVNLIIGNAAVNALNGGAGADLLRGLAANDTYTVDNVGDVVDEGVPGSNGADLVRSSVTFSLSDTVHARGVIEHLTLTGTAAINATGNATANTLTGNIAANTLNGAGGVDYMLGLGGNDTYVVDNAGDVVDEAAAGSGGIDTVQSSVTFNLSDTAHAKGFIDHVTLTGAAAVNVTGNGLGNTLTGNGAANLLNGRLGLDTMTGGAGNDFFRFDLAPAASNIDTVTDFDVDGAGADSFDTIVLENAIFTLLTTTGDLSGALFTRVVNNADADNGRTITYVSSTGGLFYDTNGAAAGGATLFAVLDTGLALTAADFFVT